MEFAVDYMFKEAEKFLNSNDVYIKYPGVMHDIDTLVYLIESQRKILLHGIIPSSGSIMDPLLCNNIEQFARFVKITKQKWLSFHFDYKPKYMDTNFDKTIEKNVLLIRKYCGENIPILIENVPVYDNIQDWCMDPKIISEYCEKYNLDFLLDISHAIVAAQHRREDIEEYISKLPLNLIKEIHVGGCEQSMSGLYRDAHTECTSIVYKLLEKVLYLAPNCEMITIEYKPFIRTSTVSNSFRLLEYKEYCVKQQIQLKRVKSIVEKVLNK